MISRLIRRTGILAGILLGATAAQLCAQMTTGQRLLDFEVLASLYAKRYAPANWKLQSLGVNIFELRPWTDRVRAAKSDRLVLVDIDGTYFVLFAHSTLANRSISGQHGSVMKRAFLLSTVMASLALAQPAL